MHTEPALFASGVTPANAAATWRHAAAAVRGITYRLAHGAAGNGATDKALNRHEERIGAALAALLDAGDRRTVGLLTEEDMLIPRVAERRARHLPCPDLRSRLNAVRRDLAARGAR